jgi:hypothetical protein
VSEMLPADDQQEVKPRIQQIRRIKTQRTRDMPQPSRTARIITQSHHPRVFSKACLIRLIHSIRGNSASMTSSVITQNASCEPTIRKFRIVHFAGKLAG